MSSEADRTALVAGMAITALGLLLLFDQTEVLELDLGWFGVAIATAMGLILLVSGLNAERGDTAPGD